MSTRFFEGRTWHWKIEMKFQQITCEKNRGVFHLISCLFRHLYGWFPAILVHQHAPKASVRSKQEAPSVRPAGVRHLSPKLALPPGRGPSACLLTPTPPCASTHHKPCITYNVILRMKNHQCTLKTQSKNNKKGSEAAAPGERKKHRQQQQALKRGYACAVAG